MVRLLSGYKLTIPASNRKKLAATEPKLVQSLVALMDSQSLKVQCQAALALRNLASDGESPIVPADIPQRSTKWKS